MASEISKSIATTGKFRISLTKDEDQENKAGF